MEKGANNEWQLFWRKGHEGLKFAWGTWDEPNKTFTLNLDHAKKGDFTETAYIAWGGRGLKCLFGEGAVALPADGKVKVVLSANSNTIDYTTYNLSTGSKEEKAVKTLIAQILAMLQMKVANVAENGSQVTIDFEKGANGNLTAADITKYSVARFTYHNIAVKGIDFFKTRIGGEDAVLDLAIHGEGNQFRVYLEQANGALETKLLTAGGLAKILNELPKVPATIRLLSCSSLESAQDLAHALNRPIVATAGKVDIYESGNIGSSTEKWFLLEKNKAPQELQAGNSLKPNPPTQAEKLAKRFVRMGENWYKVAIGSTDLSKMTILARKNSVNPPPYANRNFATIEYIDLNGNTQYKSFVSLATGKKGHTEPQILDFLSKNNIPLNNLKKLHTELRPCIDCVIDYPDLQVDWLELTWDFGYDAIDQTLRLNHINSFK